MIYVYIISGYSCVILLVFDALSGSLRSLAPVAETGFSVQNRGTFLLTVIS